MRILYDIPNPKGLGADRWIYMGWRQAMVDMGIEVFELTAFDNIENKIEDIKPDIYWTAYNLIDIVKNQDLLKNIRARGIKVFMRMDWPRTKQEVQVIRDEDIVDLYFDERESDSMIEFERQTGRKFYPVTNAANKFLHFPTQPISKYAYDIVYLGAKLPRKKWFFDNVLIPLTKKYKVGIFGPYWTLKDKILQIGVKLCETVHFGPGATFLNNSRITIPVEEENKLYSSAKICLNFHEREKDGSQPHCIANQRTFKISACGGFQICDYIPEIRKYFNEDELVMAQIDKNDWFEKIDYYLQHENERKEIQKKGTKRALKDHTYHNRVNQILELYKNLS